MSFRLLWGWLRLQMVIRRGKPVVEEKWSATLKELCQQIGLSARVRLIESAEITVPMIAGVLRPVVLTPIAFLSGMSEAQVRAVLLHELAHVRRFDYFVNILQGIICSLFFYHPVIWWLDRKTRQLRECCCDEIVIEATNDRVVYARALEGLASKRFLDHRLAPAATDGSLLQRLRIILGVKPVSLPSIRSMAGMGLFFALTTALISVMHFSTSLEAEDAPLPVRTLEGVSGQVLNINGDPVAGAEVALYHMKYYYGLENGVIDQVVTDTQGRFEFDRQLSFYRSAAEQNRDAYTVVAWDDRSAFAWRALNKKVSTSKSIELQLQEAVPRTVKVVDSEGVGIAGAEVYLHSVGERSNAALFANGFGPTRELTDAQGVARFTQMPKNSLNFAANQVGYSDSWTGCGSVESSAEIRLYPEAVVKGIVRDENGKPVSDTLVYATPEWPLHDYVYARTDSSGNFRLEGLYGKGGAWTDGGGTGEYRICLEDDAFQAPAFTVTLQQAEVSEDHVIEVIGAVRVSVLVLDPVTEEAVPFAQISVRTPGGEARLESGAEGRFSFPTPPGEVRIGFWEPPSGTYMLEGSIDSGRPHWINREVGRKDVDLTLYAPSALGEFIEVSGRVLWPDGTPAEGVELSAKFIKDRVRMIWESARMGGMPTVKTNSEGRFIFKNYPRGMNFDCYMRHLKKPYALITELPDIDAEGVDLGDFQLVQTTKREVHLVDLGGNPLANQTIYYGPYTGSDWERSISVPTVSRSRQYSGKTDELGKLVLKGCIVEYPYDLWIGKKRTSWKRILPEALNSQEPLVLTVDTRLQVRLEDLDGNVLDVIEVSHGGFHKQALSNRWNSIPILEQFDDGAFLIEKESFQFNSGNSKIQMWCRLNDGSVVQAGGRFPERGNSLLLKASHPLAPKLEFSLPDGIELEESDLAFFVSDASGQPIAGVQVVADPFSPNKGLIVGTTDTDGLCILKTTNGRQIYCEFTKEGLAPQWQANLPRGEPISVIMSTGAQVAGQFMHADGTMTTGQVQLRLETSRHKQWGNGSQRAVDDIPYLIETDADGRYDFSLLPGEYRVFAESESGGFLVLDEWTVKGSRATIEAPLGVGVVTEIFFTDSQTGEAIEGVPVYVIEKIAPYHQGTRTGSERVSDSNGKVEWQNLMPGTVRFNSRAMASYSVEPQIPYSRWWSEDHAFDFGRLNAEKYNKQPPRGRDGVDDIVFELNGEGNRFEVTMERGIHVSGVVELPEDLPEGSVTVTLVPVGNQRTSLTGDSRDNIPVDREAGQFSAWMPAGNGMAYRACAYFREFGGAARTVYLPAALSEPFESKPGDAFEFMLSMHGGGWLTGKVVDREGQPMSGVGIQAIPLDYASGVDAEPTAVTDTEGRYTMGPIRATEYEVRIDEAVGVHIDREVKAKVHALVEEGESVELEELRYP